MIFKYLYYFLYFFLIEKFIFKNFFCLPFIKLLVVNFKIDKKLNKKFFQENLNFFEKLFGQYTNIKKVKNKDIYIYQLSLRKQILNEFLMFFIFLFSKKLKKNYDFFLENNFSYNIISFNLRFKNVFKDFHFFFFFTKIYFYFFLRKKIKNVKLINNFFKIYLNL